MRGYGVIAFALCVVAGAGACNKKKDIDRSAPAAASETTETAASEPPQPIDERLFQLFSKSGPAMPVPLQALRFDMHRAELETLVPDLAPHGVWRDPLGIEGVMLRAGFFGDTQTLRYVEVTLPAHGKALLTKLWGAPVAAKLTSTGGGLYWQDSATGVQAVLDETGAGPAKLGLWPFVPWRQLLGDAPTTLGFETRPLLGMSEQQVMTEYAHLRPQKVNDGRIDLYLTGYEFHYSHTPVVLTLDNDNGAVKQLYFKLHYGNYPPLKTDMEAAFAAKLGAPVKVEGIYTTWREREPFIKMDHNARASQFVFWVERISE